MPRTSSRLDGFFDDWADRFTWVRPRGGSIGFPRLTVPGVRIDDWAADLVEAEGVLLLPGSQFGHPGNHFRLGFGRTDLPEALTGLEGFAAAHVALAGLGAPRVPTPLVRGAAVDAVAMPMQAPRSGLLRRTVRDGRRGGSRPERSPNMATTTTRRPSAETAAAHRTRSSTRAAREIQRYGTLRRLPIGLPDGAKAKSCELLNEILADSMVLYALYKKHHWLVAGPTFYQLHLLFDKHCRGADRADRPARRARPEPRRHRRRRSAPRGRADDHPAAARRRRGRDAS